MRLTGIQATNPVAMMAAYGALRLLPEARLRWDGTHPELELCGDIIEKLAARLPERIAAPEVTKLDDTRPDAIGGTEGYGTLAEQIPHEWLTAYATETADGLVGTELRCFAPPTHKFVRNARDIMAALGKCDVADKLREAIIGPWRYGDTGLQGWGWDAAMRLDAAALPKKAEQATKLGVLGAYWLAWESMPLWQMVNGRTIGMGRKVWEYPTCAEWLSWQGLQALVLGHARMDQRELTAMRVTRWVAPRIVAGRGRILGTAKPAARTPSNREKAGRFAQRAST